MFIQNYCFVQKNMDANLYRVSVGPFLEEAFKGGVVFLFLFMFSLNPKFKEKLVHKKYWLIAGMLVGLFIGLWETFIDYSPGIYRLIPTLNHVFWTAIVAGGIWFFMHASKHKIEGLGVSYVGASILHALWNYHAFIENTTGSEFTLGAISFILTVIALFLVWKFD
jgi:hypothetical protein